MTTNELILALCHEAGDIGENHALLNGFAHNHNNCCQDDRNDEQDVRLAASGDVAALVRVRTCCGLPILS